MFSLFKSKRNRWRDESTKLFDVYITSLKGLDSSEIGALLDLAIQVRNTFYQNAVQNCDTFTIQAFADPISVPEDKGLTLLQVWHGRMKIADDPKKMALVGALTIWWLSLAAGIFAELRIHGRNMWGELARGFSCSESFQPDDDVPPGLAGLNEQKPKVMISSKRQFETGAITADQYLATLEAENADLRDEIKRQSS